MKKWMGMMALVVAMLISLQGCSSSPESGKEEKEPPEQQKEDQLKPGKEDPEEKEDSTEAQKDDGEKPDENIPADAGEKGPEQKPLPPSAPSQNGGNTPHQKPSVPAKPQPQPQPKPDPKPQPKPEPKPEVPAGPGASQVTASLASQYFPGGLGDYSDMVGTLYTGLDLSQMKSYSVKGPTMNVEASEVAVFQVKEGASTAAVEKALRRRANDVAKSFEQYSPEQAEIAKKAVVRTKGNYVCLVIGSNASAAANAFEKMV